MTLKKVFATMSVTALLGSGIGAPVAAAQPQQDQNGLVNVAVGDITVSDVNVGVAANIVAAVCGVSVGPVVVLATQVDRSGVTQTATCPATGGMFTFTQA
jgi:hypothetical protein